MCPQTFLPSGQELQLELAPPLVLTEEDLQDLMKLVQAGEASSEVCRKTCCVVWRRFAVLSSKHAKSRTSDRH